MRGKRGGSRRLRIISGEWRGRILTFPDHPGIRPTPDRVRETLFNWLQPTILGARCLDLFAGSGALGLEALSRGAAQVDFVERDRKSAAAIRGHLETLNTERGRIVAGDALHFLQQSDLQRYDLIFLDPPFGQGLLERALQLLGERPVSDRLQLYIETEQAVSDLPLPQGWGATRSGEAGQVRYMLLQNLGEKRAEEDESSLSGNI